MTESKARLRQQGHLHYGHKHRDGITVFSALIERPPEIEAHAGLIFFGQKVGIERLGIGMLASKVQANGLQFHHLALHCRRRLGIHGRLELNPGFRDFALGQKRPALFQVRLGAVRVCQLLQQGGCLLGLSFSGMHPGRHDSGFIILGTGLDLLQGRVECHINGATGFSSLDDAQV